MSRIKLRNLLNLTEQAPQPPAADPAAPAPAPVAPPSGMDASGQEDAPTPESPTPETSPEPEDPSEYDFTRDFRAFEDKKNKAEADAKKVLLDKMNEKLLSKTIVANASRGYGQPKTDYTIKNVKKVSVEFWYKDYVVIAADENDKKYFLTPGINIKIEQGAEPAPGADQQAPTGAEQAPVPAAGIPGAEAGAEEIPNIPAPETPGEAQPPAGDDAQPQAGAEKPSPEQAPQPQAPAAPAAPQPQAPQTQPPAPEDPRKKKKLPVAEWIQKDLSSFLLEFMSEGARDVDGNINFLSYVSESHKMLSESANATKIKCKLLIPEGHFVSPVDVRDIKLAAVDAMRQNKYYGQYSKGSIEVTQRGRYYLLEYVKEIGWN